MGVKGKGAEEVRREGVFVPSGMTTREIMEKYGIKESAAYNARTMGFFVRNDSKPQVKVNQCVAQLTHGSNCLMQ